MSLIMLSGFTFIRNAIKYDFPIRECIESMLPLVDELVINVGKSEDGTEDLINKISNEKIRVVNSVWDDSKTRDGLILSEQTNIALDACSGRWCLYLQADEALHENEYQKIRSEIVKEDKAQAVDALTFQYFHFYGGYSMIQRPWNWYPSEIRAVRKSSGARSFGDAQTFRKADGTPLKTRLIGAHIYHYGHARSPEMMKKKIKYFHRFWWGDNHGIKINQTRNFKNLVWFWGAHPMVYRERVKKGSGWSPHPTGFLSQKNEKIVLLTDLSGMPLAEESRHLLTAYGIKEGQILICYKFSQWFGVMRKCIGKRATLVDLSVEKRSLMVFLFLIPGMITGFHYRLAHAPNGKLSKFRQRFYNAISWGCHEKNDLGFTVPQTQYARQIVRWLGIDCE